MSEIDSRYTSESELTVYNATKHLSGVRMEVVGIFDTVLKIEENTSHLTLKFNESTLIALRDVLNRWHEEKIIKRGKP